jgi:hypothetical protein
MLEKLLNQYGDFSDSVVEKIIYNIEEKETYITVNLKVHNKYKNNIETVSLYFENIESFIFKEINTDNHVIFESVIMKQKGIYVFDFSPYSSIDYNLDDFKNSEFGIMCKIFKFSVQ